MTFGEKVSKLRKEKNYTQEQLAALLGVSRQSVSKWESDAAFPETEKLIRLSALFACSLDYLLKDESTATPRQPESGAPPQTVVLDLSAFCFERKSTRLIRGVPLWHINIGPGRVAHGVFAVGLAARGVVSVGLVSAGVVSLGVVSLGLLALGCIALGAVAAGSIALGLLAFGAIAVGLFACGAMAVGAFSVGAAANGLYAALGDRAQGPIALGKSEAVGEVFQRVGALLPQDKAQIRLLLTETTPFWLRWAAGLFGCFL